MMAAQCQECGCICAQCPRDDKHHSEMHLHVEIENLRQRLMERDHHIVTMETQFLNEADKFPNGELASIKEEILHWQEKFARLYEAHKRVQRVNQNLEDKLLRIVDKCETEKSAFTKDIATLSHRLADANYTIHRLTRDNEKYRNDVNLAIQLLQCKPSNFVSQKYDSLPSEVQAKVMTYVSQKRGTNEPAAPDVKSITVPISTFPPTAMVYNVTKPSMDKDSDGESDDSKPPVDNVSASIMAKVLEERERERIFAKHCDTCTCHRSILSNDAETQTSVSMVADIYQHNHVDGIAKYFQNNGNVNTSDVTTPKTEERNLTSDKSAGEFNGNGKLVDIDTVSVRSNMNVTKSSSVRYINERAYSHSKSVQPNVIKAENPFNARENDCTDISRLDQSGTTDDGSYSKNYFNNHQNLHDNSLMENHSSKNEASTELATFRKSGDKLVGKLNVEKTRHIRPMKKNDSRNVSKYKWLRSEKDVSDDVNFMKKENAPQSQIDVINERIWKNEWSRSKCKLDMDRLADLQRQVSRDSQIDVINDRIWRTDRNSKSSQLTLIEVKGIEQATNQNDSVPVDTAASPSFSSESLVISSSDPPSSLSETNHVSGSKNSNDIDVMSSWQDRTTGPRGCSMRITPGSKNILLDNAGQYQMVLYTTGNSKPNTVLVHSAKSTKSGGSTSTSSEDNSPSLPSDNTHLQRVAEWINTSGSVERRSSVKSIDGFSSKSVTELEEARYVKSKKSSRSSRKVDEKLIHSGQRRGPTNLASGRSTKTETNARYVKHTLANSLGMSPKSCESDEKESSKHETDLISFEAADDDKTVNQVQCEKRFENDILPDMGMKLTREMEETYMKLAASLELSSRKFTECESPDIIQNYKTDQKRIHVQKHQDTTGSAS